MSVGRKLNIFSRIRVSGPLTEALALLCGDLPCLRGYLFCGILLPFAVDEIWQT